MWIVFAHKTTCLGFSRWSIWNGNFSLDCCAVFCSTEIFEARISKLSGLVDVALLSSWQHRTPSPPAQKCCSTLLDHVTHGTQTTLMPWSHDYTTRTFMSARPRRWHIALVCFEWMSHKHEYVVSAWCRLRVLSLQGPASSIPNGIIGQQSVKGVTSLNHVTSGDDVTDAQLSTLEHHPVSTKHSKSKSSTRFPFVVRFGKSKFQCEIPSWCRAVSVSVAAVSLVFCPGHKSKLGCGRESLGLYQRDSARERSVSFETFAWPHSIWLCLGRTSTPPTPIPPPARLHWIQTTLPLHWFKVLWWMTVDVYFQFRFQNKVTSIRSTITTSKRRRPVRCSRRSRLVWSARLTCPTVCTAITRWAACRRQGTPTSRSNPKTWPPEQQQQEAAAQLRGRLSPRRQVNSPCSPCPCWWPLTGWRWCRVRDNRGHCWFLRPQSRPPREDTTTTTTVTTTRLYLSSRCKIHHRPILSHSTGPL